jgi:acetyl-CoA acetyltransferase family protein
MSTDIYIVDGARTPFGSFGGGLKDVSAIDLGVVASRAALERSATPADAVDHVVFGNVIQTSPDAVYLARHVGLKAGLPVQVSALTVNRLCGSGLQAIINGAQMMKLGEAETVLAGGAENMSQAPYQVRGARWGLRLGSTEFQDYLWEALTDSYAGCDMANTAENLAQQYHITRDEVDEYALRSQEATKAALERCYFTAEIAPVEVQTRKGIVTIDRDEHPRPGTTREALAKLTPSFRADGVITAGNASGIVDGGAAVVMTTQAGKAGHAPLGRVISWATVGVDPTIMGIGPAKAIPMALERAGMTLDDMMLIEINEAFAPQYIACERELGLDREKANVNGGAIAIGHPLGASGTRIALTLLKELRRRGGGYGVASACIGGGQGIAVVFEAFPEPATG